MLFVRWVFFSWLFSIKNVEELNLLMSLEGFYVYRFGMHSFTVEEHPSPSISESMIVYFSSKVLGSSSNCSPMLGDPKGEFTEGLRFLRGVESSLFNLFTDFFRACWTVRLERFSFDGDLRGEMIPIEAEDPLESFFSHDPSLSLISVLMFLYLLRVFGLIKAEFWLVCLGIVDE